MKLWQKKRMGSVIRSIYKFFGPYRYKGKVRFMKRRIFASVAAEIGASKVTILRARKYLRVEHVRIAGRHYWTAPKNTLKQALDLARKKSNSSLFTLGKTPKERLDQLAASYAPALTDVVKELNYDCTPRQARLELETYTGKSFSGSLMNLVRHHTGITSQHYPDVGWRWVMPDMAIRDWLEQKLKEPMEQDELFDQAMTEKGWSSRVLNQYRVGSTFLAYRHQDKWFWRNINR